MRPGFSAHVCAKLHDPQDSAELWTTFNGQRLLAVGIASLAFTPLVNNANSLWSGPARPEFLAAILLLASSIMLAHGSLRAHRVLSIQHALYANLRRHKEAALERIDKSGMTEEWRTAIDGLNAQDRELAEKAGKNYQNLERWLGLQYATAVLGAFAMLAALISTPV